MCGKLFVTVETRDGSLFYLVVDYDKPLDEEGEAYETYFLNAVDGSDLTAFLPESSTEPEATPEPEVCTCEDKCTAGHINTACPVCRVNVSECVGVEPTPEPPAETEPPAEEPSGGGMGALILVLLVVAAGAAAALIFLKKKKGTAPKASGGIDMDDYDFENDDDEDLEEDEGREP